jgi:hypothetical protein
MAVYGMSIGDYFNRSRYHEGSDDGPGLVAHSTVSGHPVHGFRPPWSEAAERPTESLVSAPDGHLLSLLAG